MAAELKVVEELKKLRGMSREDIERWRDENEEAFPKETRWLMYHLWKFEGLVVDRDGIQGLILSELADQREHRNGEEVKKQNLLLGEIKELLERIRGAVEK
jgi:hypothetical protein